MKSCYLYEGSGTIKALRNKRSLSVPTGNQTGASFKCIQNSLRSLGMTFELVKWSNSCWILPYKKIVLSLQIFTFILHGSVLILIIVSLLSHLCKKVKYAFLQVEATTPTLLTCQSSQKLKRGETVKEPAHIGLFANRFVVSATPALGCL